MKKEKLKIASDIDDSILDTYSDFKDFCKKYYGLEILPNKSYVEFWNLFGSEEKTIEVIKKYDSLNRTYELNFFNGFKEAFNFLKQNYNFSYLITSRNYDDKKKTLDFFKKNIKNFDLDICYTRDEVDRRKSLICQRLGVEKIIEDSPSQAFDCAKEGIEVFLFDKPWNQDCNHENIIRVKNWYDIREKLK